MHVSIKDICNRYPNNLTREEVCHILGVIGVEDPKGGIWEPIKYTKAQYINIIQKYKSEIEDSYDIDLDQEYDDSADNEGDPEMLKVRTRYETRYIGPRSQIKHNVNSTFTGTEYTFPRMKWIEVAELDWGRKYYTKANNSIEAKVEPQWEVRKTTPTGKIINFFVEKFKEIISKKPEKLFQVKHIHEDRFVRLRDYEIFSITELLSTPQLRIREILGLDAGTVAEMYDDAKRSIT